MKLRPHEKSIFDPFPELDDLRTIQYGNRKQKRLRQKKRHRQKFREIKERDGWKCLRCGTTENLTRDHVVPQVLGGPGFKVNLQTLCGPCNKWKGSALIDYRPRNLRPTPGDHLQSIISIKGRSLKGLSREIWLGRGMIKKMLRNEIPINADFAFKLEKGLGVDWRYLMALNYLQKPKTNECYERECWIR